MSSNSLPLSILLGAALILGPSALSFQVLDVRTRNHHTHALVSASVVSSTRPIASLQPQSNSDSHHAASPSSESKSPPLPFPPASLELIQEWSQCVHDITRTVIQSHQHQPSRLQHQHNDHEHHNDGHQLDHFASASASFPRFPSDPSATKGAGGGPQGTEAVIANSPSDLRPSTHGKVEADDLITETDGYRPPQGYLSQSEDCQAEMKMWMDDCAFVDDPTNVYWRDPKQDWEEGKKDEKGRISTGHYVGNLMEKVEKEKQDQENEADK